MPVSSLIFFASFLNLFNYELLLKKVGYRQVKNILDFFQKKLGLVDKNHMHNFNLNFDTLSRKSLVGYGGAHRMS